MNHGDVFILDTGSKIFIWKGNKSSIAEKMTASKMAAVLKDRPGEEVV